MAYFNNSTSSFLFFKGTGFTYFILLFLLATGILAVVAPDFVVLKICGALFIIVSFYYLSSSYTDLLIFILVALAMDLFGLFPVMQRLKFDAFGGATPAEIMLLLIGFIAFVKFITHSHMRYQLFHLDKGLVRINIFINLYFIFLIFYTVFIVGYATLNEALRIGGGHFLYWITFIYCILLINNKNHVVNLINFIRIAAIITAFLSIFSNLIHEPITENVLHAIYGTIIRMYLPGFACSIFVIIFGYISYLRPIKELYISIIEILINLLGFMLFLARGWTVSLIMMIITSSILLRRKSFKNVIVLVFIGLAAASGLEMMTGFRESFGTRFESGFRELSLGESSFNDRLKGMASGFEIYKKMPIFGSGFVKSTSSFYQQNVTSSGVIDLFNADIGLTSILYTTGLVGFTLTTLFIIFTLKRLLRIFHTSHVIFVSNLALTVAVLVGYDYFFSQLFGNSFGTRGVAFYMMIIVIALKGGCYFESNSLDEVPGIETRKE